MMLIDIDVSKIMSGINLLHIKFSCHYGAMTNRVARVPSHKFVTGMMCPRLHIQHTKNNHTKYVYFLELIVVVT